MSDKIDLDSREIYPVGWGLIYHVVCAPADMTDEEIGNTFSAKHPPGTSLNRWVVTDNETASNHSQWVEETGSKINRFRCPDCQKRVHVLMNC